MFNSFSEDPANDQTTLTAPCVEPTGNNVELNGCVCLDYHSTFSVGIV